MAPIDASGTPTLAAITATLGLEPSVSQSVALESYLDLLAQWNATYNLTAVRDRDAMRVQHLADCLALIPALSAHAVHGRVLDVGSGGGLPGIVIAVMRPDLQIVCVDSVAKKIAFIRQVAGALQLSNLTAVHARVETLAWGAFDLVTSRAFAALAQMVKLTMNQIAANGRWVAMKGQHPAAEIDELRAARLPVDVFHVEPIVVPGLDASRCLVWMRRTQRTGS